MERTALSAHFRNVARPAGEAEGDLELTARSALAQDSSLGHHTAMSSSDSVQRTPTKGSKRS